MTTLPDLNKLPQKDLILFSHSFLTNKIKMVLKTLVVHSSHMFTKYGVEIVHRSISAYNVNEITCQKQNGTPK